MVIRILWSMKVNIYFCIMGTSSILSSSGRDKGLLFSRKRLSDRLLRRLYGAILLPRLIEERMLLLLRQGRISKWFSGMGQEAISVGSTMALRPTDYILPLHRNLGVFTTRGLPLGKLFSQLLGKKEGYTKGRDRSFHFGDMGHYIVGMISHLGAQLGIADGLALGGVLRKEKRVVLAYCGEGSTSEGDFHEALNVASCWDLPVIFLIENNGYALSTPVREQYRCSSLLSRAQGYGMLCEQVVGNDILAVYGCVRRWASRLRRRPSPVLLEAQTFRMRGHEEASGTSYVPDSLLMSWEKKDPVRSYAHFLMEEGVIDGAYVSALRKRLEAEIQGVLVQEWARSFPKADTSEELGDVYAPSLGTTLPIFSPIFSKGEGLSSSRRFLDAIKEALWQGMERDDSLILMGQDIAEYGGVFKVTEGFVAHFGKSRVRNTPLCESAILGVAMGLSMDGFRVMVEMQFADFVSCGFNQLVNNIAKLHYRWGQSAGMVIRMPTGAGVGGGPFHSQSTESWFFHTPGLKILYPATPFEAKGLLLRALEEPNPCLFFEHKALYRSIREEVPCAAYGLRIGEANVARAGSVATIVTYGLGVHWAFEAAEVLDLDIEIVNLRTLLPWDKEKVSLSVQKTHRAMVLHEACLTGGIGAEIAAWISEHLFESLDAPVVRVASLDTPVPFAKDLEDNFLPKGRFLKQLRTWLCY